MILLIFLRLNLFYLRSMQNKKCISGFVLLLLSTVFSPQLSAQNQDSVVFELRTFLDTYYGYDTRNPIGDKRLPFLYNHTRHNSFSINLAFIQLNMDHKKFRSRLGIQGGTYVSDNFAGEPAMLRHFSEANVGVRISKKRNLWLDVGILPSHIGFESAISTDNVNLSRSLVAELSPYYMAGARLIYKTQKGWEFEALLCNGWQRIQRPNGSSYLSGGTRMTFESEKYKFNWSTFIGTDSPNSNVYMRYFSNVYSTWKIGQRAEFTLNADVGTEHLSKLMNNYGTWMGFAAVGRVSVGEKWKIGGRAELYYDPERVIVGGPPIYEFRASGASVNADLTIHKGVYLRWEFRWLNYQEMAIQNSTFITAQKDNFFFIGSLAIDMNRKF
jgi:hypothetical protein